MTIEGTNPRSEQGGNDNLVPGVPSPGMDEIVRLESTPREMTSLDVLTTRYRAVQGVSAALQDTMYLRGHKGRANAYLQVAEAMRVTGIPSSLVIERAAQEIQDLRGSILTFKPDDSSASTVLGHQGFKDAREVSRLLLQLGQVYINAASPHAPRVMEDVLQFIDAYDANLAHPEIDKRDRDVFGADGAGIGSTSKGIGKRKDAKIQDLVHLARMALDIKFDPNFTHKVIDRIDQTISEKDTFKALGAVGYLGALHNLLSLNVLNNDLTAARRVIALIELIPSNPKDEVESESRATIKIKSRVIVTSAEATILNNQPTSEELTDDKIREILASENWEAIAAIGFSGRVSLEQVASLDLQISPDAMQYLLKGFNERLLLIKQLATEQTTLIDKRIANLKPGNEKEHPSRNSLAELDQLLVEVEHEILDPLRESQQTDLAELAFQRDFVRPDDPKVGFFIARLALRELQRRLKKNMNDLVGLVKSSGQYETQDQLFKRLLSTMSFDIQSGGYSTLQLPLSIFASTGGNPEKGLLAETIKTIAERKLGREVKATAFLDTLFDAIPGITLHPNWRSVDAYKAYVRKLNLGVAFSTDVLRQIIEGDNLPPAEWDGEPLNKYEIESRVRQALEEKDR